MLSTHDLTGLRRISTLLLSATLVLLIESCARKTSVRVPPPPRAGETQTGIASWYGNPYHGRRAANGEVFDMYQLTAAHRTWPFETMVRVKNLNNQKEVDVRITDRGPFVKGRIIDLSRAAAEQIEMIGPGTVKVKLEVLRVETARYVVQAGVFREKKNAEALRARLRKYGDAQLKEVDGSDTRYRVIVGSESSAARAEQIAERVRREVPEAVVVKE